MPRSHLSGDSSFGQAENTNHTDIMSQVFPQSPTAEHCCTEDRAFSAGVFGRHFVAKPQHGESSQIYILLLLCIVQLPSKNYGIYIRFYDDH